MNESAELDLLRATVKSQQATLDVVDAQLSIQGALIGALIESTSVDRARLADALERLAEQARTDDLLDRGANRHYDRLLTLWLRRLRTPGA